MSDDSPFHWLPPELLYCIFAYLDANNLTSCAMTCKGWSGPAIHTKWSTLWVPLEGLLKVATPIRQRFVVPAYTTGVLELEEKDVADSDWDLLKDRSALVSQIRVTDILTSQLESIILRNCTPFLPHLKELSIPYSNDFGTTLKLVLSPSLKTVELRKPKMDSWHEENSHMMKTIAEAVPGLEGLSVLRNMPSTELQYICSFHRLRTLRYIGEFGFTEWDMLATECPKLEALILDGWLGAAPYNETYLEPWHTQPYFPSLKTLDMTEVCEAHFTVSILHMSQFPQLIKISLMVEPPSYRVEQYIQPLSKSCPEVQDVSLEIWDESDADESSLTCLAELRCLKVLQLSVSCSTTRGGSFLSSVPRLLPDRLPGLRSLTVKFRENDYILSPAGLVLADLPRLLLKVPALELLEISLHVLLSGDTRITSTFPNVGQLVLSPLVKPPGTIDFEDFIEDLAALFPTATLSPKSKILLGTDDHGKATMGTTDNLNYLMSSFHRLGNISRST